jgi:hypothetical protein
MYVNGWFFALVQFHRKANSQTQSPQSLLLLKQGIEEILVAAVCILGKRRL